MSKIHATFVKKRIQDSGSDNTMDYYVYEFSNILDDNGEKFDNKWIKKTQLLEHANLSKGKKYIITLSGPITDKGINMPYPIEIYDGKITFIKKGGSIRKVEQNGTEKNLSLPSGHPPDSEMTALLKLAKGSMTEDYLIRKNSKGVFFCIHIFMPKDKRTGGGNSCSLSNPSKGNYVLIEKETQEEINKDLGRINSTYGALINHFKIETQLVQKRKK